MIFPIHGFGIFVFLGIYILANKLFSVRGVIGFVMIEDPDYDPVVDFRECVKDEHYAKYYGIEPLKVPCLRVREFLMRKYNTRVIRVNFQLVIKLWECAGWVRVVDTNISLAYCLVLPLGVSVL